MSVRFNRSLFTFILLGFAVPITFAADTGRGGFRPGELWLDDRGVHINAHGGGIIAHDGVYYWFGEHKIAGEAGNVAHVGVHVYSSRDLVHWRDGGIALAVSDNAKSDIVNGCIIERPKVIYNAKTHTFVMWFHLELKGQGYGAARAGLAISDKATGPYKYVGSFRPNKGVLPLGFDAEVKTVPDPGELKDKKSAKAIQAGDSVRQDGQMSRDMTLFVDDDGKGYLLTSSEENRTLHLHELTDDYRGFSGKWTRIFPNASNEAPALFKRAGKYYLFASGTTYWNPNPGRSAMADSIWGPWTVLGNPCRGTQRENATTFASQSTYVLPVSGRPGDFIYMGDRWRPKNAIDGRYVWLPVEWENDRPVLRWHAEWDLSFFTRP
ncbi:MAG: family 43 glycosylhydrolase [Verrucomicrobia bacterium]|nr:family 43 glycosylhydrolase [Verrucomicrobiota bacterium]